MDAQRVEIQAAFQRLYGRAPTLLCNAGGRVNLIGEHTDYHDGLVFPAAIDLRTVVAAAPRTDGVLRIRSENLDQELTASVAGLAPSSSVDWKAYVLGPFWALGQSGLQVPGADILIQSTVPFGGGLSSSASVEVALVGLGARLAGQSMAPKEVARIARKAENDYAHVPCGVMDQLASACGQAAHALLIDCRTLELTSVPFPTAWALIIADSRVKHSLGSSEYAKRQKECAEGLALLRQVNPELIAARDLELDLLESEKGRLPERVYRRLRHVVTENQRVMQAKEALEKGDGPGMGQLLYASHQSLARDYEVSCQELDILVELAQSIPGVLGARLTGAGFGGNTVNLVQADKAQSVREALAQGYQERTGRDTTVRIVHPSQGLEVHAL